MTAIILFFLILCSGSAFASAFSTARFEKVAPLTVFTIITILYFFGLINQLSLGAWAVVLLSATLWILAIFQIASKRLFHTFLKRFFTPAFVFFTFAFLFVIYSNYGRLVSNRDDLAHWADTVKILFFANRLATVPALFAQYQSYPPAMSLLQYLPQFIGRMFGGSFSEWQLYVAFESAVLVLFVPAFSKLEWSRPHAFRIAAIFICACCVPGILHTDVYRTLMIDPYLGLVAGFGFSILLLNDQRDVLDNATLVLSCLVVTLTKQAGAALAVFLCVATLLDALYPRKQTDKPIRYSHLRSFGTASLCIVATTVAYASWQWKLRLDGADKLFSNPVDLSVIWNAIAGKDAGFRGQSLEAFFRALFEGRQDIGVAGYIGIPFSFAALFFSLLVLAIFIALAYRARGRDMRRFDATLVVLFFGCILFIIGLAISYLFQFSQAEALSLASFDRYVNIPLAMIIIVLFLLAADLVSPSGRASGRIAIALLVVVVSLAPLKELGNFALRRNFAYSKHVRAPYETSIRLASESIDEPGSKIGVVSMGSRDFDLQMLTFCMRPLHVADYESDALALTENDIHSVNLTAEDWIAILIREGFDYVLLYRLSDSFASVYSTAFAAPETITQGGLYRLSKETGLLEIVGSTNEF